MRTALFVVFFMQASGSWANDSHCSQVFQPSARLLDQTIVRFGHLPMESRIPGRGGGKPLWTISILGRMKDNRLAWQRSISTLESTRYLEFPLPRDLVDKATQRETTNHLAMPLLDFVYQRYAEELARREVFSPEFVRELRQEDLARLEHNLTLWGVLGPRGEISGTWGLYRYTEGPYAGQFEIIRLATEPSHRLSLSEILPLVTEYFNSIRPTETTVFVRTDRLGARAFLRLGAEIRETYDNGKKFELEMSIQEFITRFESPDIQFGNQPLQLMRFLDENFIF